LSLPLLPAEPVKGERTKILEVEMEEQLHKRFTDEGVKALLESYLKREIEIKYALEIL